MSETVISSSSNSIEKAIDKYYDTTSDSNSSNSSHSSKGVLRTRDIPLVSLGFL